MMQNYIKRSVMLLGAAALVGSAMAQETVWQNINAEKLPYAAFVKGWSGVLTKTQFSGKEGDGVAECYNGAFNLYQEVHNLPAGEYTLTVNAFYRYATNDLSKENMKDGANHNAFIYINDAQQVVEGLFDKKTDGCPNSMEEADAAFKAGEYLNTVKYTLTEAGTLRVGIKDLGGMFDEWTCFDNFKLVGPNGEVALVNGGFEEGMVYKIKDNGVEHEILMTTDYLGWEFNNVKGSPKSVDTNRGGGTFRKCNASQYNYGTIVELEAGKYRFGVQSFLRYGGGSATTGGWWGVKSGPVWVEGESAFDRHNNGTEDAKHDAFIYVTNAGIGVATPEGDENTKPVDAEDAEDLTPGSFYNTVKIKNMYDEQLAKYPENEPQGADEGITTPEGYGWTDSGWEYEAAKVFANNPNLYRNYIEFELTAPGKVWVGMKKDENAPTQYWHPFADFTLEKAVESAGIASVADDANAPVEYYNIQGMRVANPANGLYIVKQGNKVSKQYIR